MCESRFGHIHYRGFTGQIYASYLLLPPAPLPAAGPGRANGDPGDFGGGERGWRGEGGGGRISWDGLAGREAGGGLFLSFYLFQVECR